MSTMIREIASPEDTEQALKFMRELYAHHGIAGENIRMPAGGTSYLFHRRDKIIGVTTLLDGSEKLQLENYFDLKLDGVLKEGDSRADIIEIARTASVGGYGNMNRFLMSLMRLVRERIDRDGRKYWIAAMKEPILEMFRRHNWPLYEVPARRLPVDADDPMTIYLNTPPRVRVAVSPAAEMRGLAARWLRDSGWDSSARDTAPGA